jgi:hypothetical protein
MSDSVKDCCDKVENLLLTEKDHIVTPDISSNKVLAQFRVRTDAMFNYNRTDVFDHCIMTQKEAKFFLTARQLKPKMDLLFWFGYDITCHLSDITMTFNSDAEDIKAFERLYHEGIGSENLCQCIAWEI